LDRLTFELSLPVLVDLEDGPRTGSEGAVVEERDLGIEGEELFQFRPTVTVAWLHDARGHMDDPSVPARGAGRSRPLARNQRVDGRRARAARLRRAGDGAN